MRSKKLLMTTAFTLLEELAAILCGFIVPKLILSAFGSTYNGLITSISQFLGCTALLRFGIGGATKAALYKPLEEKDTKRISEIVKATDIHMRRIGLILAGLVVAGAALYPFLVSNEFSWFFSFSLFIIIGVSTFAESFFGITYSTVLAADQRAWVQAAFKTVCYLANTALSAILIYYGAGIHLVKACFALIYALNPIFIRRFVLRRYHLDFSVEPDFSAISQRWDAFWAQLASFVMLNTDLTVLTVFSTLSEVSVYGVYNNVIRALRKAISAVTRSLSAAFGNMLARNEEEQLRKNLAITEFIVYTITTVASTCAGLLMLDFVRLYTKGIVDANYCRPGFSAVIVVAFFFDRIRIPYQAVSDAAGHFKQNKKASIAEPIINLTLSILLVRAYGLIGVAIGTLVAAMFRTVQFSFYVSRNLVRRSVWLMPCHCAVSLFEAALSAWIINLTSFGQPASYLQWVWKAVLVAFVSGIITLSGNIVLFRADFRGAVAILKRLLKKK